MTDIQKKFYNKLPVGEWVPWQDIMYSNGTKNWNFQLALNRLHRAKLIEVEFREGVCSIRRIPTSEIMSKPITK